MVAISGLPPKQKIGPKNNRQKLKNMAIKKAKRSLKGMKLRETVKAGLNNKPRQILTLDEAGRGGINSVAQGILAVAAVASVAALAVVAPNAILLLAQLPKLKKIFSGASGEELITKNLYYLKSRGYVELKPGGKDVIVKISQKGRKKLLRMSMQGLAIKPVEPWDGCWWVVLGDIPTELRYEADRFRMKLRQLGFYPLQRTTWVHPHDPRNELDFITATFSLDRFVTVMRADYMDPDDEKKLKSHFKSLKVL